MDNKLYITGHRVPDTDSICSALAYAELKERTTDYDVIPIRIGELNQETRFVLEYFGVNPPIYMDSMQPRLIDIPIDRSHGVAEDTSLHRAGAIIQEHHLNSLAVVDHDEQLVGIISLSNITRSYANIWNSRILGRSNTGLANILEVLSGKVLYRPQNPRELSGEITIYAMESFNDKMIQENDIVIMGDRIAQQEALIRHGISMLVLTNHSPLDESLEPLAEEFGVTVINTGLSTFMAARLLPQAVPVEFEMAKDDLVYFHQNDLLDEVRAKMASTRFRSYPVLDAQGHVKGSVSRYHLINTQRKKLILVDHNERAQSVGDIDRAEILEIIDHHRVSDVSTIHPIYFRNVPVGSTCTIISQMFFEMGVRPSREAAGLMCSAIISDTLLFRSPTTTDVDRQAVARLAPIAGIDPTSYAEEMFRAGTDLSNKKPTDILTQDVKFFDIEGNKTRVAQVFTTSGNSLKEMKPRLIKRMQELLAEQSEDTYILAMTDIFKENSIVIPVGAYKEDIALEFSKKLEDGSFVAEGLLSRKKQLIPMVTSAIAKANQ